MACTRGVLTGAPCYHGQDSQVALLNRSLGK